MAVSLIWAQAQNGVIGQDGGIPWHLPEDLAHFRELTTGSTVVMGRRTWESLPERFRPLPGRRNIVVTRNTDWSATGAEVRHSIEAALEPEAGDQPRPGDEIWVIGGGEIYAQALPRADRLEITEVQLDLDGDTRAPELGDEWQRTVSPAEGWAESRTGIRYRFVSLERRAPAQE